METIKLRNSALDVNVPSCGVRVGLSCVLCTALLASPLIAAGQAVPLDADAFTSFIADRLRASGNTNVEITIQRPLVIRLRASSGLAIEAQLADIHRYCIAVEGRCSEATQQFADASFAAFGQGARPLEADQLRVVIRHSAYVNGLNEVSRQRGMPPAVATRYVGELWMVLAISGPGLIRIATTDTLKQLGFSESKAFDVALSNIRNAKLPIVESAQPLSGTRFEVLGADDFEPSRFLMHAEWADIARARGGYLIVSIPASNALIFGSGRTNAEINQLRGIAAFEARRAQRAVSTEVFRWRPDGWELVKEPNDAQASGPVMGDTKSVR